VSSSINPCQQLQKITEDMLLSTAVEIHCTTDSGKIFFTSCHPTDSTKVMEKKRYYNLHNYFYQYLLHLYFIYLAVFAFIALTLLVWHQEEHQACKNCDEELVWLSVSSEVQAVCIWSSRCHCIPEPHHLLPHLNPGWFYLSGTGLPRLSCINALHHYILLKMYNLNYLKL